MFPYLPVFPFLAGLFHDLYDPGCLALGIHRLACLIGCNPFEEAVRLAYEAHSLCKRARDKPAEAANIVDVHHFFSLKVR